MFTSSSVWIWDSESFLKSSSFLKNLHLFTNFFTFVIQFYTFSYVLLAIIGFYANLRISCAIFRRNTIFFGHTIAKIQIEMKNTLHKKKTLLSTTVGVEPTIELFFVVCVTFLITGAISINAIIGIAMYFVWFWFLTYAKIDKIEFWKIYGTYLKKILLSFLFFFAIIGSSTHLLTYFIKFSGVSRANPSHWKFLSRLKLKLEFYFWYLPFIS